MGLSFKQPIPEVNSGRSTIDSMQRMTSFSSRSKAGILNVISKKCGFCNHHKCFSTLNGNIKCCRCKK